MNTMERITESKCAAPVSSNTKPGKLHLPQLDSIRGIAILMVVAFHAFSFAPNTAAQATFNRFVSTLSQGVPLFFILSGFLISLIVFDSRDGFDWKAYSMRRFAKIAPPFFLSIALLTIQLWHQGKLPPWTHISANLVSLPNFLRIPIINPVSWSLFVEMHFYLALPLVYFGLRRFTPKKAELLTVATFAIIPTIFRFFSWTLPADSMAERFFLWARFPSSMDFFSWGILYCWCYRTYRNHPQFEKRSTLLCKMGLWLLPATLLLCACLLSAYGLNSLLERAALSEISRFLVSLSAFLLMFCTGISAPPGKLNNRVLQYIGLVSYEWFLFHIPIILFVRYHCANVLHMSYGISSEVGLNAGFSYFTTTMIAILTSFAVAAAIYHWFSQPLLRALRK